MHHCHLAPPEKGGRASNTRSQVEPGNEYTEDLPLLLLRMVQDLWQGNLLLIGDERAQQERQRADQAEQQVEQERQKRQRLVEHLRSLTPSQLAALGIAPQMLE